VLVLDAEGFGVRGGGDVDMMRAHVDHGRREFAHDLDAGVAQHRA
jgi:hypothetical protein